MYTYLMSFLYLASVNKRRKIGIIDWVALVPFFGGTKSEAKKNKKGGKEVSAFLKQNNKSNKSPQNTFNQVLKYWTVSKVHVSVKMAFNLAL